MICRYCYEGKSVVTAHEIGVGSTAATLEYLIPNGGKNFYCSNHTYVGYKRNPNGYASGIPEDLPKWEPSDLISVRS